MIADPKSRQAGIREDDLDTNIRAEEQQGDTRGLSVGV